MSVNDEVELVDGGERLRLSSYGASLRGYWQGDRPVVTGYSGESNKVGGQGDVLIPFPGRVAYGRYVFDGTAHEMEQNDKEGPNAIHGFVRATAWEIAEQSADDIAFVTHIAADEYEGYPFSLGLGIRYALEKGGFRCSFSIRNTGDTAAPVAAGFHPYFTVGSETIDSDLLTVPFGSYLEYNERLVPTGNLIDAGGTANDFQAERLLGGTVLNTCFLNPARDSDGRVRVRLRSLEGGDIAVWMDRSFTSVVLYSGDPLPADLRRRSLAIEPMTSSSDAFNHPEWGLRRLEPGELFEGAWGVTVAA